MRCFVLIALIAFSGLVVALAGPAPDIIPYARVKSRPANHPYCQAMFPFCPTGSSPPVLDDDDVVDVWALKAPIWEFKFGDLMGKLHGYHDAIGMVSHKTGKNYTMEWYELDQLLNCTFPHEVVNATGDMELVWCDQGAYCFYDGIDDIHWSQNGTMDKVTEVAGKDFNELQDWLQWDNNTAVYYESWSVIKQWEDDFNQRNWTLESWDCKDFVLRVFDKLHDLGANFTQPKGGVPFYSYMMLSADKIEEVSFEEHREDILKFYSRFQPHLGKFKTFAHLLEFMVEDLLIDHTFYLHYNSKYYKLHMTKPFIHGKWAARPLPGLDN